MGFRKLIFIFLGLCLLIGTASATTLDVGSGYTYSTVNAALSAATSGDTILIHPGTYNERLIIKNIHDLTFQGDGYPTVNYTAASLDYPTFLVDQNAYNITFRGLHIVNMGDRDNLAGGIRASVYPTYGIKIEDNIFDNYMGTAIYLHRTGVNRVDPYQNCNNSIIRNNTIRTTGKGVGISVYSWPSNLTIENNNVSVSDDFNFMKITTSGAYGIKVEYSYDSVVRNNIVNCCSYSLICVYGQNFTCENNIAYGKANHNFYEYGYTNGIFRNNSLIGTNYTWASANPGRPPTPNMFYNPGSRTDNHMVTEDIHYVNVTWGAPLSVGGHRTHELVRNITIDAPQVFHTKMIINGVTAGTEATFGQARTSDGLIVDNLTVTNHSSSVYVPFWIQGAGTDLTPVSHTVGDYSDLLRDNITLYDVKLLKSSFTNYDFGIYASNVASSDTNVSLILANSNLTTGYNEIGAPIVCSIEDFYFTDIDITDGGLPASKSRIFVTSNTSRLKYNEKVPYFTGNYVDPTQDNYTYQLTAKGMLDTPDYIETLDNGQTGTRNTPNNCLMLASTTKGLQDPWSMALANKISRNVYYNLSVSGGSFDTPVFYTVPDGQYDIVTLDSLGNYNHRFGTKSGSVTGYHPTNSMYKTNSYERGTVDLTIPITDYAKTVIPMGVAM